MKPQRTNAMTAIGKRVLDDTMHKVADKPARPGSVTKGWLGRGAMHSLAGRADQAAEADGAVGGHPEYTDVGQDRHETRERAVIMATVRRVPEARAST